MGDKRASYDRLLVFDYRPPQPHRHVQIFKNLPEATGLLQSELDCLSVKNESRAKPLNFKVYENEPFRPMHVIAKVQKGKSN